MKPLSIPALVLLASTVCGQSAFAAGTGYIKLDSIKGESERQDAQQPQNQGLKSNQTTKPVGLLLPAVQSARDSGRKTPGKSGNNGKANSGNAETTWKVEKGEK